MEASFCTCAQHVCHDSMGVKHMQAKQTRHVCKHVCETGVNAPRKSGEGPPQCRVSGGYLQHGGVGVPLGAWGGGDRVPTTEATSHVWLFKLNKT